MPRWLLYLLIALFALGLVLLLLWAVVVVPPRLIDTSGIPDPAKRLDEVNALRTTLAGVLGGLAVAAGAIVAALNFRETGRQNRAVLELQRRGQVTERFTRAIEQLGQRGDEKLDVRIGAVYALEQIAQDSVELHWPIMEVLTAHLREHAAVSADRQLTARPAPEAASPPGNGSTPSPDASTRRPQADHQAIATVIGRRHTERDPDGQHLNLRGAHLEWAYLRGAHFERAYLRGAHLEWAHLRGAHLERADLRGALLEGANLRGAHLEQADLRGALLVVTDLRGAHLEGAHLEWADLRSAEGLIAGQLRAARSVASARLPDALAAELASSGEGHLATDSAQD